eukprot:CAMPEP_0170143190 /NCGR_PEP_ID=MMETSP0033_2-20121228/9482_1 /TAXON_ID=195969 /ORGANISM="Dolichomastix tenuilepis, Strain CCMP3274" /LENGTH=254 /DNA_ID=CAMNT_0010379619 /DNA_START=11 /DNA_END=775 /DNA_ORIENTATION=+
MQALKSTNSFVGSKVVSGRRATRAQGRSQVAAQARDAPWAPGSQAPEWLDGSLPGDFGFDPLGLGKDPASLARFREAEIMHCRWCMWGFTGSIAVEALGQGTWFDAPKWALTGEHATYFGVDLGPTTLVNTIAVQAVLMGGAELMRGGQEDADKRIYPGGIFDPLGWSKGADFEALKVKEVKNGRLAMLAMFGTFMQTAVTGKGPLENWGDHVADPWNVNVTTTSTIAVPYAQGNYPLELDFWNAALPPWYPGV